MIDNYKYRLPVQYKELDWKQRKEVREQYVFQQEGCCYYCSSPLTSQPPKRIKDKRLNMRLFPKDFLKYPIHLHHCHVTGMTIGAVHSYCNGVLWQYEGE